VVKKPTRTNYFVVLRLGSLIVAALGVYSFLFSMAGFALASGNYTIALSYPLNLIAILTTVVVIVILLVVVMISTRRLGGGR